MSDNEETRLYEAMFVVGANRANQDWGALMEHIHGIITRHGGEVVNSEKWDERKLAYPMAGNTRAVYILIHFNASPNSIEQARQDFDVAGSFSSVWELPLRSRIASTPSTPGSSGSR